MRCKIPRAGLSRREVLRVGFLGGVGLSLSDYLRASESQSVEAKADGCIFIHLKGGPSHLDTLDMKPGAPSEERGDFGMIQTAIPGLSACEYLPKFAKQADEFTLVRGISHGAGAHPLANQYLFTGNAPSAAVAFPAIGSVMTKERPSPSDLPSYVSVPSTDESPGYMGIAYAPLTTTALPVKGEPFEMRGLALEEGLSLQSVRDRDALADDLNAAFRAGDSRSELLDAMDQFGKKAREMILSPRAREAFDTSGEPAAIANLFADDDLGQSLLLAMRLIEHGVRFVTVVHNGWDTHLDNFERHKKLLRPFDAGITALVTALTEKGLLDRTLVMASGEFGRTPTINKNAGRDHWPRAMWSLFAGGGVKPGSLIGGTDAKGHGPDDATELAPDDLGASIYHALGVDPKKEYYTKSGRPVMLVAQGKVIEGLFA